MISIMVVDDDYLVLKGIRQTIKWQEYGFQIVGEASNCEDALAVFQETQPDIVITDIRMGEGNGLDLAAAIKAVKPETHFVIISGYEQFEYAKRALEHGISAYLLKPIQNDELLSAMLMIQEKLEERSQIHQIKERIPSLKSQFIKALLQNQISSNEEIEKNCVLYHLKLPQKRFTVVKLCIDNYLSLTPLDIGQADEMIQATLEYTVKLYEYPLIYEKLDFCDYVLISPVDDTLNRVDAFSVMDFLNSLQDQFGTVSQNTFSAGISAAHDALLETGQAYEEAVEALRHKLKRGNNSIIKYTEVSKDTQALVSLSNEDIETVITCIKNVDYDGAIKVIQSFFAHVDTLNNVLISNLHHIIAEMFVMIFRAIFRDSEGITKVYGHMLQPFSEVRKYETIADIRDWTVRCINQIFEDPNIYLECTYHPEIQQAIAIILSDYMEPAYGRDRGQQLVYQSILPHASV